MMADHKRLLVLTQDWKRLDLMPRIVAFKYYCCMTTPVKARIRREIPAHHWHSFCKSVTTTWRQTMSQYTLLQLRLRQLKKSVADEISSAVRMQLESEIT